MVLFLDTELVKSLNALKSEITPLMFISTHFCIFPSRDVASKIQDKFEQCRSTPTSGPPQSKRKSPCSQVISL